MLLLFLLLLLLLLSSSSLLLLLLGDQDKRLQYTDNKVRQLISRWSNDGMEGIYREVQSLNFISTVRSSILGDV